MTVPARERTTAVRLIAAAVALTAAGQAHAAVTVYSNQAAYDAATAAQFFFIDFNGSTGSLVSGNSFSPDVTFGSPEATDPTQVLWSSDAITDAGSTTAPNFVGPIDGRFTSPVRAFALLFSSAAEAEQVSLFDELDVLIDAVLAPNPSGFFGVVSDTPIKSFLLDNGLFPSGDPDRFFVDDFRANEVPEPLSAAMLGSLGLAGLFARCRRTR